MKNIKHTFRNFCIWFFTVSGISLLYRTWVRRRGPLVRVLVFHDVHNRRWFERLLEDLTLWFHFITPEEFHAQTFHPKKINILITFDDGYASWESTVCSVLEEFNLKALFFVNSALLDVAHDAESTETFMRERLLLSPHEPLTWDGAKKLHALGHTIGGHSCTHANLTLLKGDTLTNEILNDKHTIERQLETTITDFAYPFGTRHHVSTSVEEATREIGYSHVYTAMSGFVDCSEPFSISRMCVESDIHSHTLKRWILGGYDVFLMFKKLCAR